MEVVKEEEEPTAEANNINSISRASSHQPVAVSFSGEDGRTIFRLKITDDIH